MCPARFKRKEDAIKETIKRVRGWFWGAAFTGSGDSPSSNYSLLEIREVHDGGGRGSHARG